MKAVISNVKVVFSKATHSAFCRFQVASAVIGYAVSKVKLSKLHAVRDARKREEVGRSMRVNALKLELALSKLKTI